MTQQPHSRKVCSRFEMNRQIHPVFKTTRILSVQELDFQLNPFPAIDAEMPRISRSRCQHTQMPSTVPEGTLSL